MEPIKLTEKDGIRIGNNILKFFYDMSNIPRGTAGQTDCPICEGKGTMTYCILAYKGYILACCSSCGFKILQ